VQDGTHDRLINVDGVYSQLYNLQAMWYTDNID